MKKRHRDFPIKFPRRNSRDKSFAAGLLLRSLGSLAGATKIDLKNFQR